jgi:hypothetical protein
VYTLDYIHHNDSAGFPKDSSLLCTVSNLLGTLDISCHLFYSVSALRHSQRLNEILDKQDVGSQSNNVRTNFEKSQTLFRELNESWGLSVALFGLGRIAGSEAEYAIARSHLEESLSAKS